MTSNTKLPKKQLYFILLFSSIIIFSESLTVMMKVKDIDLFKDYLINMGFTLESDTLYKEYFSSYVGINLFYFFFSIIVPVSLSIHSYLAFISIRISKLFVFIWSTLIFLAGAYNIIRFDFQSVFYYLNILCYILLLIVVLSLNKTLHSGNKF